MWLSLHMVQVCIQSLNMDNNFLQNIISRKTRKGSRKWLFWYGWGIWLYGWGEYCYWDVKIVKQFHYAPLNPIQNKQLWLEFAALNFILLQSFTSYANFFLTDQSALGPCSCSHNWKNGEIWRGGDPPTWFGNRSWFRRCPKLFWSFQRVWPQEYRAYFYQGTFIK